MVNYKLGSVVGVLLFLFSFVSFIIWDLPSRSTILLGLSSQNIILRSVRKAETLKIQDFI